MRQLLPFEVSPVEVTSLLDRSDRQAHSGRPWVMANFVESVDGAYAISGKSAGLSNADDRKVFHTLRAASDVILVAAGTARDEGYRRPTTVPELLGRRRAAGWSDVPRLTLVSRSLSIPADQPFLTGDGPDPLVFHPVDADTTLVPAGVELRAMGTGGVDLDAAMRSLYNEGVRVVLCEGGPTLLGQLHDLDLLDELFLTVSPVLAGGNHIGFLRGAEEQPRAQRLHRVWESEDFLFLTYRTVRD